eukprot:m.248847 g.248847  ORF g.248847 m.248847 type:complete len:164 (+) comp16137_c2_seq3:87-578(+)
MLSRITTTFLRGSTSVRPTHADKGIYGGRKVGYGKKVAENKKTPKRFTRQYKPNIVKKKLYSELLGERFELNVTPHALRCIDKAGGFDNYILGSKDDKLDSTIALELKERLRIALRDEIRAIPDWESKVAEAAHGSEYVQRKHRIRRQLHVVFKHRSETRETI